MNRRDVIAGAAGVAAGAISVNAARAESALPPINPKDNTMKRGPAYEKDIFVIRAPTALEDKAAEALCEKVKATLGDDVIVIVLDNSMTLERLPALSEKFRA